METVYYLVPLYSDCIAINGKVLKDIYFDVDPLLYTIDEELDKLYQLSDFGEEYKDLESNKKYFYQNSGIPRYLIIVQRNGRLYELNSDLDVEVLNLAKLESHMVDDKTASGYYSNESYHKKASNLFNTYSLK